MNPCFETANIPRPSPSPWTMVLLLNLLLMFMHEAATPYINSLEHSASRCLNFKLKFLKLLQLQASSKLQNTLIPNSVSLVPHHCAEKNLCIWLRLVKIVPMGRNNSTWFWVWRLQVFKHQPFSNSTGQDHAKERASGSPRLVEVHQRTLSPSDFNFEHRYRMHQRNHQNYVEPGGHSKNKKEDMGPSSNEDMPSRLLCLECETFFWGENDVFPGKP